MYQILMHSFFEIDIMVMNNADPIAGEPTTVQTLLEELKLLNFKSSDDANKADVSPVLLASKGYLEDVLQEKELEGPWIISAPEVDDTAEKVKKQIQEIKILYSALKRQMSYLNQTQNDYSSYQDASEQVRLASLIEAQKLNIIQLAAKMSLCINTLICERIERIHSIMAVLWKREQSKKSEKDKQIKYAELYYKRVCVEARVDVKTANKEYKEECSKYNQISANLVGEHSKKQSEQTLNRIKQILAQAAEKQKAILKKKSKIAQENSRENFFKEVLDEIKCLIDNYPKWDMPWGGGVAITIANGTILKVPHGVAEIYKASKTVVNFEEKFCQIMAIAQTKSYESIYFFSARRQSTTDFYKSLNDKWSEYLTRVTDKSEAFATTELKKYCAPIDTIQQEMNASIQTVEADLQGSKIAVSKQLEIDAKLEELDNTVNALLINWDEGLSKKTPKPAPAPSDLQKKEQNSQSPSAQQPKFVSVLTQGGLVLNSSGMGATLKQKVQHQPSMTVELRTRLGRALYKIPQAASLLAANPAACQSLADNFLGEMGLKGVVNTNGLGIRISQTAQKALNNYQFFQDHTPYTSSRLASVVGRVTSNWRH